MTPMLLMPTEEKLEMMKEKLFLMPLDLCNQNSELSENMSAKDSVMVEMLKEATDLIDPKHKILLILVN